MLVMVVGIIMILMHSPHQHDPPSNEGGVNALVSIINSSSSSNNVINVSNDTRDNIDINAS